jgi:hypothetical protein
LKKRDNPDDESSDDGAVACPLPQGVEIFNIEERERQILEAADHIKLANRES